MAKKHTTEAINLLDHPGYAKAVQRMGELAAERTQLLHELQDAEAAFAKRAKTREQIAQNVIDGLQDDEIDPSKYARTMEAARTRLRRVTDAIELFKNGELKRQHLAASRIVCDKARPEHHERVRQIAALVRQLAEACDEETAFFDELAGAQVHCIDLQPMAIPGMSIKQEYSTARMHLRECVASGFISDDEAGVLANVDPLPPKVKGKRPPNPTAARGPSMLQQIQRGIEAKFAGPKWSNGQ